MVCLCKINTLLAYCLVRIIILINSDSFNDFKLIRIKFIKLVIFILCEITFNLHIYNNLYNINTFDQM